MSSARRLAAPSGAPAAGHDRLGRMVRRALAYAAMTVLAVVALVPFAWMLSTSLKSVDEVFAFPPRWIPEVLRFDNYTSLWRELPVSRWIANSALITATGVLGHLVFCSLAAYAFARIRFRGREPLFYLFLVTMMLPGQVQLIPNFILMRNLGWLDTYWALIVPGLSGALGIFLLRQFFLTLPRELEDAARVDGAGYLRIYWKVILPLSGPALATVAILTFLEKWNDFLWPLVTINSVERMPLPVGLSYLMSEHSTDWTRLMAGDIISILPVLLVFAVAQRYFVRGIALTGLKG
jgi:multiple sugar transport system permease protein